MRNFTRFIRSIERYEWVCGGWTAVCGVLMQIDGPLAQVGVVLCFAFAGAAIAGRPKYS